VREDKPLQVWLDLSKLYIFDPESGENLTAA
jgi:hypothetical protein